MRLVSPPLRFTRLEGVVPQVSWFVEIVPLLVGLVAALFLVRPVRSLGGALSLRRSGRETTGLVVESHLEEPTPGPRAGRRGAPSRVETVEFTTPDGLEMHGVASYSDVGTLDRTGAVVRVIYHPERPELFAAPKGAELGVRRQAAVTGAAFGLVALVLLAVVVLQALVGGLAQ